MATLLGRFTAGQRAVLTEHVGATDGAAMERLGALAQGAMAHGASLFAAKQQAVAILARQLGAQASVLAFSRVYLLNGLLLVCALPLLFFWKTGKARGAGGPVH